MAQPKRPGDFRDEPTKPQVPMSKNFARQREEEEEMKVPKPLETQIEDTAEIKKLKRFIEFREIHKLKKFLHELGGPVGAVSLETKNQFGLMHFSKIVWTSDDMQHFILEYVRNGDYLGALEFVESNEQNILEAWIDDYLFKNKYHEAAVTLRDFSKIKPSQLIDDHVVNLEVNIDQEILGTTNELLKKQRLSQFNLDHDRIWSMVHRGSYSQAAELCEQMNVQGYVGQTLEQAQEEQLERRPTILSMKRVQVREVKETPGEIEERHKDELYGALPGTPEEMKSVFKNLPELISHYHHLAHFDENNAAYIEALKGTFELSVNKLFDEGKIVVQGKGMMTTEDKLLQLIDEVGDLGFHLYINRRSNENKLHLFADYETDPDYYSQVEMTRLFPEDMILDEENFVEQTPPATGRKSENPQFAWISKVITIDKNKAKMLRRAA